MRKFCFCAFFILWLDAIWTEAKSPTLTLNINGEDFEFANFGSNGAGNEPKVNENGNDKSDFSKPLYIGNAEKQKLKQGFKIPLEITLKQEIKTKGAFEIVDEQKSDLSSFFQVSVDKTKIDFEVKTDIPEEDLKNFNPLIFLLQLTIEGSKEDPSHTVIIIFLYDKPPETPQKIAFEKSKYEITTYTEYTGMIQQFVAKLETNDAKSSITYELPFTDEPLKSSLKINPQTGMLEIVKSLPPKIYNFKISAKIDDKTKTESDVVLTTSHVAVCDSSNLKFSHSQLIKHFPEEKTGEILEPFKTAENCLYEILWQKPEGDYFELDQKTGSLKLKTEIKRNWDIFKDTKHPKFVIKLSVKCGTTQSKGDQTQKDDANKPSSADHYFDIPYDTNNMIVIILIDKASPSSILSTDKIFIGYPKDYEIITHYAISRITSVSSVLTDADNNVEYSLVDENCPFSINSRTGNIYPSSYYNKNEDLVFTISAKDASKKEEKATVTVKILAASQMVEIFFMDATPENIDKLLQDYSAKTSVEIKPLAYAVLPITDEERTSNKGLEKKQTHLLRALCYAIDEKQSIVNGEVIVDKLKTSSNIFSIQAIENKKIPDSKNRRQGNDDSSSFVMTMGIISVILALGVIITVLYLIVIRRRRNNPPVLMLRRNNARNSVTPLEDDMEVPSRTRWVDSHVNVYNKYDQMNDTAYPNPAFQSRAVSYSNTNDEIVMMENRRQTTSNEHLSSNVSSFKPDTIIEDPAAENITKSVYRDLDFTFNNEASSSNNVPVLDVTSLPPVSTERRRRKPNGET